MSFNLTVRAGQYTERPVLLSEDDVVEGTLVEVEGQDFDWYIIEDASYAAFVAGNRFRALQTGRARPSGHVRFKSPKTGGFHLVLDCGRMKNDRMIEVRLSKR